MRVPFLGAIAVASLTIVGCSQPAPGPQGAKPAGGPQQGARQQAQINHPAPDFSVTTFNGKTLKLSDLKGKPVVVNFWASWCHYCAQEAPDLETLYNQYKSQGLEMVGAGADPNDPPDALKQKARELKLTYPNGPAPDAARLYGVTGFPTTCFVDRNGVLVSQLVGARPKDEIEAEVKKLL